MIASSLLPRNVRLNLVVVSQGQAHACLVCRSIEEAAAPPDQRARPSMARNWYRRGTCCSRLPPPEERGSVPRVHLAQHGRRYPPRSAPEACWNSSSTAPGRRAVCPGQQECAGVRQKQWLGQQQAFARDVDHRRTSWFVFQCRHQVWRPIMDTEVWHLINSRVFEPGGTVTVVGDAGYRGARRRLIW